MTVALIDNGSLEPAAQLNLRAVAAALSAQVGLKVAAVSWKHSDRIRAAAVGGESAWTLAPWMRAQLGRGEREFIFVPFFISAQGAIGSSLHGDLDKLRHEAAPTGGFHFTFTDGLVARGSVAGIVAERIREIISSAGLRRPAVVVVDHGGPSPLSAAVRDSLAGEVRNLLGHEIGPLAAASMEGTHGPLLADQFAAPGFDRDDVVVALLFLSPGRHAGPEGDVAQICRLAETRSPALRCHLTPLVGTHPGVVAPLALALRQTLDTFSVPSLA
jgi:hypothetical protein